MQAKYLLQLACLSALWGASFILTRISAPQLGPNFSPWLRMTLGTLMLAIIMRVLKHRWPLEHWKELMFIGFLAVAGPHALYSQAALFLPGGYGAMISVTSVLFGAFASAWLDEEVLTRGKLGGCLLGLAGAALVVRLGPVHPSAELILSALTCLGAAALSGIATPYLKRATTRMEPLSITAGMHAASVLLLFPGAVHDFPNAHFTPSALAAVSVLGIATSGLAYWMFMRIMQHVPPMASMTANFMSTGFGVLWSVLLLGEATSLAMAVGGGLIVIACLLVSNLNPLDLLRPSTQQTESDY